MDSLSNFASTTLASGIDAIQSTAIVTTGHGDRFPSADFNVIIWDASYADMTTARYDNALAIYRVESRTGDTFTFVTVSGVREAQEGTSAIAHNTSEHTYNIAQGVTAKLFTDVLGLDQSTPQTISGRPIFQDGLQLGTTPTVGAHSNGKLYYDEYYHTLVVQAADDCSFQLGQESVTLVHADTNILNGQVVYFVGVSNGLPNVALAKADNYNTSLVFGVATQNINAGTSGIITVRGEIHDLDTTGTPYGETWNVGDVLYLSPTVSGAMTTTTPIAGVIEQQIGRVLTVDDTTGEIFVHLTSNPRLTDLADVSITLPTIDQSIRYNGVEWVNGPGATSSAGPGIEFFNCTPVINARTSPAGLNQAGTDGNGIQINSLSKTPVTTTEQTQSGQAVSDTRAFAAWLYDTALGRTSIDAGVWEFETYAAVDTVIAGRVTTNTRNLYQVVPVSVGSVTISGVGANSRTAYITSDQFGGTYFAANATNTIASWLQTPTGIYQITAVASSGIATITVPTGYTNETGVTFNVWNKLFGGTSATITSTGANYAVYSQTLAEPAFTIAVTDKLGQISFVTSNNTTTLTLAYNGTTHTTHFATPLITLHNNLAGLQGGTANQEYHLTLAQHTIATQEASGSQAGYLNSTDWETFNSKEPAISAGTVDQYWRGDKTWQILPTSTTSGIDAYSADFTVSGWGGPTDGYYTQDFTHNLGKAAINVTVWDLTSTPALTITDVDIINNDVVRLKVLANPDKRFAGRVVVSSGGSGANSQYQDTGVHRLKISILDPNTAYVKDQQICLWPYVDAPIFITSIHATCDIAPPNDITSDLMYADNFISLTNSGVINAINTVSGIYSTDSITSSAVGTGKCIYLNFTSLPDSTINQFAADITFEYQTGV